MRSIGLLAFHGFEVVSVLLNPQAPFVGLVMVGVAISVAAVTCKDWAVEALCFNEPVLEE